MSRICGVLVCAIFVAAGQSAHAAVPYSQTQPGAVGGVNGNVAHLTFTDTQPALTDATLWLVAQPGGELFNDNKRLEQLTVDGVTFQTPGSPAGWVLPVNFLDGGGVLPPPVTIPMASLNGFVADGQVVVSVTKPGFLSGGVFDFVLEYRAVPEPTSLGLLALGGLGLATRRRVFRYRTIQC